MEHFRDQPSAKPEDFFMEDVFSSPRFKANSKIAAIQHKVQFVNRNAMQPVQRSFVGTSEDYRSHQKTIDSEQDKRNKELQNILKKGTVKGSRII